jgi:hypothetical protein
MQNKKKKHMFFRHLLNAPFIWILIVPLVICDFFGELYHQIGFRLCGIPLVKRSQYVKIDRHKLKYLNLLEKVGCVYCGYANGFLAYASEIAARTEKYWCGIKHKKYKDFVEPKHHKDFVKYGDEKAFKKKYL